TPSRRTRTLRHAIARRFDRDPDRIAASVGHVDLLGGIVPGHRIARGQDGARELRQIEYAIGREVDRLAGGGLAGDAEQGADHHAVAGGPPTTVTPWLLSARSLVGHQGDEWRNDERRSSAGTGRSATFRSRSEAPRARPAARTRPAARRWRPWPFL